MWTKWRISAQWRGGRGECVIACTKLMMDQEAELAVAKEVDINDDMVPLDLETRFFGRHVRLEAFDMSCASFAAPS